MCRIAPAAAAVVWLTVGGCGGAPEATVSRTVRTVPADAAARQPFYPRLNRRERSALAADGLERATPPQLRKACAKAAGQTAWLVICPPLVPDGRLSVQAFMGVAKARDFTNGYQISMNSAAIRAPDAPDPGHWMIAAGTAASMRDLLTAFGRSGPRSRRRLEVGRVAVMRFREPEYGDFPGVYGGHVVYQWTKGEAVMQVSAHGENHERLLQALVRVLSRAPDPTPG